MKARALIFITAGLLMAGTVFGLEVNRVFNVSPGGELSLKARQGDIQVKVQPGGQVSLFCRGLSDTDLEVNQSGNLIQVVQTGRGNWGNVRFEVVVPERFNLNLDTDAGDVRIDGDLEGMLKINTHGGDISFRNVRGEADVRSSGGDIRGQDVAGNSSIRSMGGDIQVGAVEGTLKLSTHGGDVVIGRVGGGLEAKTLGGDIVVGDVDADAVLSTLGGDIEVGRVSASASLDTKGGDIRLAGASGEVKASTAGGDIDLREITGSIDADTAGGDIEARLVPRGSKGSRLVSRGGDIVLRLDSSVGATVEARIRVRSSWSRRFDDYQIISDFPAVSSEKDAEGRDIAGTYRIGGGGPTIQLETVNGTIQIRRN